jgi:hypothetical protein
MQVNHLIFRLAVVAEVILVLQLVMDKVKRLMEITVDFLMGEVMLVEGVVLEH